MPPWIFAGWGAVGMAAAKAALMYVAALAGLRVTHRRTLAQWSAIDFAAAIAVGAIVGRTAVAAREPLLVGVVALLAILVAHGIVTFGRLLPSAAKLTDHRVRILVDHGRLRRRQLLVCGLTEDDLFAQLRQHGVYEIGDLRYILYERNGELTVIPDGVPDRPEPDLVRRGVRHAAGR